MNFFSSFLGYRGALKVKDSANFLVAFALGGLLMFYLMIQFYLQVDVDTELPKDVALQRTSFAPPEFTTNPKDFGDAAEAFLAFIMMRFSKAETMRFKKLHRISFYIKVIGAILLILGLFLTFYEYLLPGNP